MKVKYLFVLALLAGCQKEKTPTEATVIAPEKKTEIMLVKEEKFLKTDTISISEGDETSKNNYMLAHLLNQKADKDSIITQQYQLDFYQDQAKTVSSKITIEGYQKGSEWGASYGLSSTADKKSSFIHVSFGYPACGYTQNNYLYYLKNKGLQLVYEWDTMSDSGWGSWVEFTAPTGKSETNSFYCKRVAFEPEDDNEDMGTATHSDSIVFQFKNQHWTKQLLTAEGKTYFEKKMSFNEFHKIQ
ncbi:hypothetical protein GJU43_16035 [Flavobacterium sp. LC2016-23]|uniref:hypothetical protein n=1 Tax=Flavobacterium sp. LC2016-23 TaxID=2666330 RepID=UPI0012B131C4|nr:hypothetical protein [Flavobacterium sp. LC2016-23]MRX40799.1 hypothetical protein [Flavobacterium sp. LC2016-23]